MTRLSAAAFLSYWGGLPVDGLRALVQPGWNYEEAEEAALELEGLITELGIRIRRGSDFERHVLDVLHLVEQKRAGRFSPEWDNYHDSYRTLIGVHELAKLILAARNSPSFPSLIPHLRLLNEGSALQNIPSSVTDQATNKLFELFMATLALQCGTELVMDDPENSSGENPDVLITIGKRRWGIACKVLHRLSPQNVISHLIKGIDQIDRSSAEIGIVAFNVKNVLHHDQIWPLAPLDGVPGNPLYPGVWQDPATPFQLLTNQLDEIGEDVASHLHEGYVDTIFAGRKSIPGMLFWGHSTSAVLVDGKSVPSSVRLLNFRMAGPVSALDHLVFECLSWAAYAGSPNRPPKPVI